MPTVPTDDPRAAYVHVPFCARRCGYCNFTVVAQNAHKIPDYLLALETELSWLGQPRPVDTLYLGGGTPTYLNTGHLQRLLALVTAWHPLRPGAEFTVEANPVDVIEAKAAVLADYGVTRLSLGAQSFHGPTLKLLERDHRAEQIVAACETARRHIPTLSMDLIFGVPDDLLCRWSADLDRALEAAPDHLSTYGLTFEKGTTFWNRRRRGELAPCEESLERDMFAMAIQRLTRAGLEHYEVSSFARPGNRCRHNQVYWTGRPFHAAGPGAARYVGGRRETNHRSSSTYVRRVLGGQSPVAEWEMLDAEDRAREQLVFGLRLLEGVDRSTFAARTGFTIDQLAGPHLAMFVDDGLLHDDGQRVALTPDGLMVSDALWSYLLRK